MKVFIDTNTYLQLFTPSGDQADYIGKLIKLVDDKKISIIFPKIIQNELLRNIGDASDVISKYKTNLDNSKAKEPKLHASFDEEARGKINKAYSLWSEGINELHENYQKLVDDLKKRIFEEYKQKTIDFPETETLVQRAYFRKLKGYPPGKGHHLGDQLSWEILLENCADEDLTIVSDDSDWIDKTNKTELNLNQILEEEWAKKGSKKVKIFDSLGKFIKQYPEGEKITEEDINKEKQKPFFNGYPYFLNPQSVGTPSLVSGPSIGTYLATGPAGPSILSGSPAFLPKSTQGYVDSGSVVKTMECPECREIIMYTNIDNPCPNCGSALYS